MALIARPAFIGAICFRWRTQCGSGRRGQDRQHVEQAKYDADRGGRVTDDGRDAEAEQGDQHEVEDGTAGGAQRRAVGEGQGG